MAIQTVLYTLGIFALIKGIIVLLAQKSIISWALKIARDKNGVKKMAILEIVIAIILILIGSLI